eukprot:1955982-Rhodomonas_salina.2
MPLPVGVTVPSLYVIMIISTPELEALALVAGSRPTGRYKYGQCHVLALYLGTGTNLNSDWVVH